MEQAEEKSKRLQDIANMTTIVVLYIILGVMCFMLGQISEKGLFPQETSCEEATWD